MVLGILCVVAFGLYSNYLVAKADKLILELEKDKRGA